MSKSQEEELSYKIRDDPKLRKKLKKEVTLDLSSDKWKKLALTNADRIMIATASLRGQLDEYAEHIKAFLRLRAEKERGECPMQID